MGPIYFGFACVGAVGVALVVLNFRETKGKRTLEPLLEGGL